MQIDLKNPLLMLPGPVPLHERVLNAMSRPMINHRGPEFAKILNDCSSILKEIFKTQNDILIISGSGTAGMEAAVSNVVKGDLVVTIVNGKFGERFEDIVNLYGTAISVKCEWGQPIDLNAVEAALKSHATVITMVHNETSVGILNPAKEVGELARKYNAIFILDGVSSIGGNEVFTDEWGVDIAILGSQKCIAVPPGLSAVSVSKKAYNAMGATKPPYYLNLKEYQKSAVNGQTPFTPAVSLFFALHEALNIAKECGIQEIIDRHKFYATVVREFIKELGLELFPTLNEYSEYSNTVTAIKMPDGFSVQELRAKMKEKGILIVGGQAHLKNKIFRIGHMGNASSEEITITLDALKQSLIELGVNV